jgi:hypothetical protein
MNEQTIKEFFDQYSVEDIKIMAWEFLIAKETNLFPEDCSLHDAAGKLSKIIDLPFPICSSITENHVIKEALKEFVR